MSNPIDVIERIRQSKGNASDNVPAVPVHIVIYDNPEDIVVERNSDGVRRVVNHGELSKTEYIRGFSPKLAEKHNLDIVDESRNFWRDEFANISLGEQYELL